MIEIRLATHEDALRVASELREVDKQEAIATAGEDYAKALIATWANASLCWVAENEEGPIALFGVNPGFQKRYGFPWLMATDRINHHFKDLLKLTPWYVQLMNEMYPLLLNYADCRNTSTQRWLKWSGFTFGQVIPDFGVGRVPFIQFHRYRNVS